jgi:hypothetical protein
MFATIAGPYPPIRGDPDAALEATLGDQIAAGLGIIGDGRVRALSADPDVTDAVEGWERAAERAQALAAAAGVEAPPVKACLVGPCSTPGPADAARDRIRQAVLALAAAGAPVIQLDEPWLATPAAATEAGRAAARDAWSLVLDGVTAHVTLAIPAGGAEAAGPETLAAAPFGSYLVDLIRGPDDWRALARLPGERGAILGVADLRRAEPDTKEVLVWAGRYAASMHGRGLARVGLAPSAGLERLSREAARDRLAGLADAAALAGLPPEELARRVDPRSIDARSAALGRYEPHPRTVDRLKEPRAE